MTINGARLIQSAIADEFQVLLLDQSRQVKPRLTALLMSNQGIGRERLRNVRYLRLVADVRAVLRPSAIDQALIVCFEIYKDGEKVWTSYSIHPYVATLIASPNPQEEMDIKPFLLSGHILGSWRARVIIGNFTRAVLDRNRNQTAFLRNLSYQIVFKGEFVWEVTGSNVSQLDETGQYRNPALARHVRDSEANFNLDDI